jgi:quercetin dioxygenase-like cupin family protein
MLVPGWKNASGKLWRFRCLKRCGCVQREGGPIESIHPGDIIWFPPDEKHWHGAAPSTAMTHIAIGELLDGKAVEWKEEVSDEQYNA